MLAWNLNTRVILMYDITLLEDFGVLRYWPQKAFFSSKRRQYRIMLERCYRSYNDIFFLLQMATLGHERDSAIYHKRVHGDDVLLVDHLCRAAFIQ